MQSTVSLAILVFAVLVEAILLFLALFEPDLPYTVEACPESSIDSEEFLHLMSLLTDSHSHHHTQVEVLANGENYYEAELEAIRGATHSVHIEAYIFQRGEVTKRFVEALTERAKHGVKVRMVIDAIGSFSTKDSYFRELTEVGGRVEWYHPFQWATLPYLNNRTHRELIVVDGKIGFIGGSGFADHWLMGVKGHPRWRDTMFRVRGESVAHLQAAFAENWLESSGEILADERYYSPGKAAGNTATLVIDSSPSAGRGTRARILFQTLLATSRKSIHITTPYFLPDASARAEICRAIEKRGVEVKIIVPGKHSDHMLTRRSSRRIYGELLKAGARIFEYDASMLHVKCLVIDEVWCVVGSTNFDHRSFGLNDEVNLAARSPEMAALLEKDFVNDLASSNEISYAQWNRRPVWERVHESIGSLLERQE